MLCIWRDFGTLEDIWGGFPKATSFVSYTFNCTFTFQHFPKPSKLRMPSVIHTVVRLLWTTLSYTFSMLSAQSASGHHYSDQKPLISAVVPLHLDLLSNM